MAQENEVEENEAVEGEEKKGKKGIIIIAAVGLIALIAGGVVMSGVLDGEKEGAPEAAHEESHEGDGHGDGHEKGDGKEAAGSNTVVYYELPEFLVNLSSQSGRVSFLKMSVTLELKNKDSIDFVETRKPKVLDTFNTYLRELRPSDLAGSAGIYRLREELMARINKTLGEELVLDILFGEILVQ